jgi:hypothetical protein
MGELLHGSTYTNTISEIPAAIDNMKLFVYIGTKSNIIQKFSIVTEDGFTDFVPDGDNYKFTLEAEKLQGYVGTLRGELQFFFTDGRVGKASFDFTRNVQPSASNTETA